MDLWERYLPTFLHYRNILFQQTESNNHQIERKKKLLVISQDLQPSPGPVWCEFMNEIKFSVTYFIPLSRNALTNVTDLAFQSTCERI